MNKKNQKLIKTMESRYSKVAAWFKKYESEFGQMNMPEYPTLKPDLCACIILDTLFPENTRSIRSVFVGGSEGDEIVFEVDDQKFVKVATEETVRKLVRCGVVYDELIGDLSLSV